MSENLEQMLEEAKLQIGEKITGEVVSMDENGVTLRLQHGFEGRIPLRELSVLSLTNPSEILNIGDSIQAIITNINAETGSVTLSKRQLDGQGAWEKLQDFFTSSTSFDVLIRDVVKGGLVVDLGVRGFIPASLVDRKFIGDLHEFKGKTLKVKVVEIDPENNKLILSRKAILDDEQSARTLELLHSLHEGDVLEGTVQRLTNFGVFVDIGGADGLVHISEMSWEHIQHPSEMVKEGDKIRVKILKVDAEHGKISLSMKENQPDPWEQYANEFQAGTIVQGIVQRVVEFGAFVELRPGVEGLVHVSQISDQHVAKASDVLKPGQNVQVKILSIEPERKRISLSIREANSTKVVKQKEQKRTVEKLPEQTTGTGATLGDLFGDLFKNR